MKIANPWARLRPGTLWHEVDNAHNDIIYQAMLAAWSKRGLLNDIRPNGPDSGFNSEGATSEHPLPSSSHETHDRLPFVESGQEEAMSRRSVLDIGCGYGSLTEFLRRHGLNAVGIDSDPSSIAQACRLFPRLSPEVLHVMASEQLSFADGSFDAVALRDALHHLFEEGDVSRSLGEIRRVLDPDGVLVIFDPQPNAVVRFCRRVVNHQDAECSSDQAVRLLEDHGWTIEQLTYTEAFALLLSGGYVGPNLVPSWQPVSKALLSGNRLVTKMLNGMGLGRWTLWRYVLTARPPLAR